MARALRFVQREHLAHDVFRSSGCRLVSGARAYWLNASTMPLSCATCLTMVCVERASISASLAVSLSARRWARRSAESWIGVSGFLISCARRRATSPHAAKRCACSSRVMSSNTTTKPASDPASAEPRISSTLPAGRELDLLLPALVAARLNRLHHLQR